LALLLAAIGCVHCSRAAAPTDAETSAALQSAVSAPTPAFVPEGGKRARRVWQEEQRFYERNGYQLVWIAGNRRRTQIDGLIRALRVADQDGLRPTDYNGDAIDQLRSAPPTRQTTIDLDLRATHAYLHYGWDLLHGTIDPEEVDPHWHASRSDVDLVSALEAALRDNQIEQSLQNLPPKTPQYLGLKHQLALATQQGDEATIQRVATNMDRWRWLPKDVGSRYVMVNIPAMRLEVMDGGTGALSMNVIIGKKGSPTPVLSDQMTSVVFSPYWNIPDNIAEGEIAPKAERDPAYLARNRIEIDEEDGRYRQRPGAGNSLGLVKFVFPNHFNVYLHDTPARALFDRVERDLSHGCVRVEQPLELAKYVLRDRPEWTVERIDAAMHAGVERSVALKEPLPIHLVYFTAWEEDGALKRAPDVYGHDRRHDAVSSPR
jgi:murein L,D-transpeptidase YcbB/YkuD